MRQRAIDQDAFEVLRQLVVNLPFAGGEEAIDDLREAALPVLRRSVHRHFAQLGRQIGEIDLLPGRHYGQPVTDVFELAHVAGEIERRQMAQRRLGKTFGIDPKLLGALLQKMPGKNRDVLAPLAQTRQANTDDVEAVKKIFAEEVFLHPGFEVLVRCRDDANIGLDRRVTANAVVVAVGKHPQQPRLQLGRHVADFIEEERPALGLLKTAAPLDGGAGEGAAFVTKKFGFKQIARNRRGIDGNKCLVGTWAVPMHGARDQLFTRSRLAGDHHRRARLTEATNRAKNLLHGRRLTKDVG